MVNALRKIFIKDYNNIKNTRVRESHGKLAAFVGIFSNLFLFIIKVLIGIITASVSILADSINNLSDMGSSVVTLIGFKMMSKPADEDHPYGHERIEYIAGLIVAIIVIFVGGSLFITSIDKISNYEYVSIDNKWIYITIAILSISIIVKIWQAFFNIKIGKLIDSVALEATALDSRNDAISTFVILIGNIVLLFWKDIPFSIDGVLGIVVSLFILISGFKLIKETIDPIIGVAASKEFVDTIIEFIKSNEIVLGIHDVVCHMYGQTKCFMTLHVEVDSSGDVIHIHDEIDKIEKQVRDLYNVQLCIHMDPLEIGNEVLDNLKSRLKNILYELDSNLSFHDFRMVKKIDVSTLLFDIVVPHKYKMTNQEILKYIESEFNKGDEEYSFIVDFDNNYVKRG